MEDQRREHKGADQGAFKNRKELEIIFQAIGSSTCGQCCVAMIAGRPVDEICKVINKKGSTSEKDLTKALTYYQFKTGPKLEKLSGLPPELCIVNLRWDKGSMGHWVVCYNDWVYDPAYGKYKFNHKTFSIINGRAVSFLRVHKK